MNVTVIDDPHRIRLVGLDVDGVLTDGGIYLGDAGEYKRYDIQDGFGVLALREAGIKVAVVTGRVSESVRVRAQEMRVDELAQDAQARKLPALLRICDRLGITPAETAFVGDDFPDLAIMRVVGLPVAVANAAPEVRAAARVHLSRSGGHGAVREFAELLLKARGEWTTIVEGIVANTSLPEVVKVAP
ncbi:MAG TPA: HAD hydrolase family protein [Gemmatimonadaceae bacterium]|jgi:3-deoxy-D-manno-octulosonate 8-phosphate phosphatase (KDO 8-P phosphatase)|nr:HAD hydrolase family protein [Gemmatimonadaceae bacterium]